MRNLSLIVAAATLALTAGCSSSDPAGSATASDALTTSGPHYVAMGDSYSAGPQLAQSDGDSGICDRSLRNYPQLVAKEIGAAVFSDVSCSGATTQNVLEAAPIGDVGDPVPAEVDAVDADTTLVTIGIGGNDDGLFSFLSQACTEPGTACADYLKDKLPDVLKSTQSKVENTIAAIKGKAPKAEVILVGYLRVSPESKGCDALGGDALDTGGVSTGEKEIDEMLAKAAAGAGITYVSMNGESKGHDACSSDAWTNGIAPQTLGDGASLHPNADGMAAVATAVEGAIS